MTATEALLIVAIFLTTVLLAIAVTEEFRSVTKLKAWVVILTYTIILIVCVVVGITTLQSCAG